MYASSYGRFSTPDPLLSSGRPTGPQTWNRYVYVLNNPLVLTDPDGLYECKGSTDECSALRRSLADANATLRRVEKDYGVDSKEYKAAKAAVEAYGCESKGGNCVDANGKTLMDANGNALKDSASNVMVDFTHQGGGARTTLNGDTINISLSKNFTDSNPLYQGVLGNEGSHINEINAFLASGHAMSRWVSEYESFFVQAVINEAVVKNAGGNDYSLPVNPVNRQPYDIAVWHKSWEGADKSVIRANRRNNIETVLTESKEYLLRPPSSAPRSAPRRRRTR